MLGFVIFNVIIALSTNLLGVIVPELSGYIEYDILSRIITLIGDLITSGLDEIMALFGI